ncbi:MAG: hypothetical protein RLZZ158_2136 [Cyanobacteriota bacterium]|jgi:hypothetical protein
MRVLDNAKLGKYMIKVILILSIVYRFLMRKHMSMWHA